MSQMMLRPPATPVKAEDYDSYDELLTEGEDEEQEPATQPVGSTAPTLIQGFLKPYRTSQYSASSLNRKH